MLGIGIGPPQGIVSFIGIAVQSVPFGSTAFIGLFKQYANILHPMNPCPVLARPSALMKRQRLGS